ncbi:MAG TPA: helix-turn-helix domain-containing protein, partial [Ktedonobacterales bacterium]|nr:helix-turn-helix domain-containing protein [Ktedonobacterales bacterium]
MESIAHAPGNVASTKKPRRPSRATSEQVSDQLRGSHADPHRALLPHQAPSEEHEPNTLLIEDPILSYGFVQLPKLVLYACNLSRDAKLLYAVLLGYAWQEQRCFPGYTRLCDDLDASENMVRKYMRELEAVHLLSQRRRGQGRTNIYTLHDLRTAKIAVQDRHKNAVLEPQESHDNEEPGKKQTEQEQAGIRNSNRSPLANKAPRNERLLTQAPLVSTAKKESVLQSGAGRKTDVFSVAETSSAASSNEADGKATEQRKKETAQVHQFTAKRRNPPVWLSGSIVDFSREFHDEAATTSNITRAAHLFERAGKDPDAFLAQVYAARRITQGRANIQKRAAVGKNPSWPHGFPNRMPYFFRVLEDLLGVSRSRPSEAGDEVAEAGLATVSEAEVACVEERAEAEHTARPLAQAELAEEVPHEEVGSGSIQEKSLPPASRGLPTAPEPASSWTEETETRGLAQEDPYDLEQRVLSEEAQRYVGV